MSDAGCDPDRIDDEQIIKDIALLKGMSVDQLLNMHPKLRQYRRSNKKAKENKPDA